uniref:Uncharacterized protein n=1 Tax=Amphimedon queenslandica TaxID=400682 RepID=A0A1X7TLU2_AMPQE
MHFRPTKTSKTPVVLSRKGKGKLHAKTIYRNEYERSAQLDLITVHESTDLRNYSLYMSSTTGRSKKESIVRAEIAKIGKLMSFSDTLDVKEACRQEKVLAFLDHLARDVGLGPSGLVGKANCISHLVDYLKEESNKDYFKFCKVGDKLKAFIKTCNKERKRLEREKIDLRLEGGVEDYTDEVLQFLETQKVNEKVEEIMGQSVIDEEQTILLRRVAMCRSVTLLAQSL